MAASTISSSTPLALLLLLFIPLLIVSPVSSSTCTSQKFPGSANYTDCVDLPTLNSFLHWSYDHANSILSVAFIASPAKPDGWVAWGLNPTAPGMLGTQALLAYAESNGSMVVKTYNISSYDIKESQLSFDVLDKRAEMSNGVMRIFSRLTLPAGMTTVNNVWQVGPAVKDGSPQKHDFSPANMNSAKKVEFVKGSRIAGSPGPAPSPSPAAPGPSTDNSNAAGSGGGRSWLLEFSGLLLLVGILAHGL